MEYSSTTPIAITVILVLVAALFVWLSLTMAAAEGAVARVTRASLNNLILEVQTDSEASQFLKMKKIDKIHRVQRLIADRYATAGSCAFFRIEMCIRDRVYGIEIDELGRAIITMTLTTPACPLTDLIEDECASTLAGLVEEFRIDWTWDPRWTMERITPEGRDQLAALGFSFDNMPKY